MSTAPGIPRRFTHVKLADRGPKECLTSVIGVLNRCFQRGMAVDICEPEIRVDKACIYGQNVGFAV